MGFFRKGYGFGTAKVVAIRGSAKGWLEPRTCQPRTDDFMKHDRVACQARFEPKTVSQQTSQNEICHYSVRALIKLGQGIPYMLGLGS